MHWFPDWFRFLRDPRIDKPEVMVRSDAEYWEAKAEEVRTISKGITSREARGRLDGLVQHYERLAEWVREWERTL